MGVWIETSNRKTIIIASSHTLRGCVDWNSSGVRLALVTVVTPCVGVWIETVNNRIDFLLNSVTPCVGVWIETNNQNHQYQSVGVTPCVGVWIETRLNTLEKLYNTCHTLRGCVDWNLIPIAWLTNG